jgi:hypothetical protein
MVSITPGNRTGSWWPVVRAPHHPHEGLSTSRNSAMPRDASERHRADSLRRPTARRPLLQVIQQIVLRDLPKSRESGVESGFGLGQVAGRGWEVSTNEAVLLLA